MVIPGIGVVVGLMFLLYPEFEEFRLKLGEYFQLKFNIRKRAEDVAAKAEEVERMEREFRTVSYSLAEAFYLSTVTRHIFPLPEPLRIRITGLLDVFAEYAVPDPNERTKWIADLQNEATRYG